MKKTLLILGAAVALVGCKQEGGTTDQYNTDRGINSSSATNFSGTTRQRDTSVMLNNNTNNSTFTNSALAPRTNATATDTNASPTPTSNP